MIYIFILIFVRLQVHNATLSQLSFFHFSAGVGKPSFGSVLTTWVVAKGGKFKMILGGKEGDSL